MSKMTLMLLSHLSNGQIVNIKVEKTETEACFNGFVHVAFEALLGKGYLAVEKMSIELKREDWVVFIRLFKTVIFFSVDGYTALSC